MRVTIASLGLAALLVPAVSLAQTTPWGDPDLQGVWSSDDMEGVGIAAGGGRGGGRGAP